MVPSMTSFFRPLHPSSAPHCLMSWMLLTTRYVVWDTSNMCHMYVDHGNALSARLEPKPLCSRHQVCYCHCSNVNGSTCIVTGPVPLCLMTCSQFNCAAAAAAAACDATRFWTWMTRSAPAWNLGQKSYRRRLSSRHMQQFHCYPAQALLMHKPG